MKHEVDRQSATTPRPTFNANSQIHPSLSMHFLRSLLDPTSLITSSTYASPVSLRRLAFSITVLDVLSGRIESKDEQAGTGSEQDKT